MRTYLRFLLLGSNVILLMLMKSCSDHVGLEAVSASFKYVNESMYSISTKNGWITLEPSDSVFIVIEEIYVSNPNDLRNYAPPINSGVIYLDDILCDTLEVERIGIGEGPAGIENYQLNTNGKVYEFTYRFTDADFDDAVPCEP